MKLIDTVLGKNLNVWNWHDCVELAVIIVCCYALVCWLDHPRTKKLLLYVFGYAAGLIVSYFMNLPSIYHMLLVSFPVAAIAVIVFHQECLQKNFITPTKIMPATTDYDWPQELMQTCLVAINLSQSIICAIQHQDDLHTLLTSGCHVGARFNRLLMMTLLNSKLFQDKTIIWLTTSGNLVGINCAWAAAIADQESQASYATLWAIACKASSKTDAIFFKINPESNSFDVAVRGNVVCSISSDNCLKILRQHLALSYNGTEKVQKHLRKERNEEHSV